jgi:hypothetical protein
MSERKGASDLLFIGLLIALVAYQMNPGLISYPLLRARAHLLVLGERLRIWGWRWQHPDRWEMWKRDRGGERDRG